MLYRHLKFILNCVPSLYTSQQNDDNNYATNGPTVSKCQSNKGCTFIRTITKSIIIIKSRISFMQKYTKYDDIYCSNLYANKSIGSDSRIIKEKQ